VHRPPALFRRIQRWSGARRLQFNPSSTQFQPMFYPSSTQFQPKVNPCWNPQILALEVEFRYKLLSNFAFNFNLRRYTTASTASCCSPAAKWRSWAPRPTRCRTSQTRVGPNRYCLPRHSGCRLSQETSPHFNMCWMRWRASSVMPMCWMVCEHRLSGHKRRVPDAAQHQSCGVHAGPGQQRVHRPCLRHGGD